MIRKSVPIHASVCSVIMEAIKEASPPSSLAKIYPETAVGIAPKTTAILSVIPLKPKTVPTP